MACWKCSACGQTVCDLEVCPTCSGNGRSIKKAVHDHRLKEGMDFFNSQLSVPFIPSEEAKCIVCGTLTHGRLIPRANSEKRQPFCKTCYNGGLFKHYESEYIFNSGAPA